MTQRTWSITPLDEELRGADVEARSRRPHSAPPPRSGQPWTDVEYEQILAAARDGVTDIDEVASRIGRGPHPTLAKARRLLPVSERAAPVDRVLVLLRTHQEDPGYDWRRTTLEEPPPRPVIAPPALSGLSGLQPDDLVTIAHALASSMSVADQDVLARVGAEVQRRGLRYELVEHRAGRLYRQTAITWEQALDEADSWLRRSLPGTALPQWDAGSYGWSVGSPPDD